MSLLGTMVDEGAPTTSAPTNNNDTTSSLGNHSAGIDSNGSNASNGGLTSRWEDLHPVDLDFKDGPALSLEDPRARTENIPENKTSWTSSRSQRRSDASTTRKPLPVGSATVVGDGPAVPIDGLDKKEVFRDAPRPRGVEPTRYGQAYSERNPPPNIQAFREHQQGKHSTCPTTLSIETLLSRAALIIRFLTFQQVARKNPDDISKRRMAQRNHPAQHPKPIRLGMKLQHPRMEQKLAQLRMCQLVRRNRMFSFTQPQKSTSIASFTP
jgi:hypothetical protein